MKTRLCILMLGLLAGLGVRVEEVRGAQSQAALQHSVAPPVSSAEFGISSSGRHLTLAGKPFFWLGDTVWLLAQLPSREELELYLRTRARQGFTVIQLTAVMGEERV